RSSTGPWGFDCRSVRADRVRAAVDDGKKGSKMRRDLFRLMACGVALALLAAGGPAGAQQGPIKIGLIVPLTGVFSPNGRDMANGFALALGQVGNKAAGRDIQVITEDDQGTPPQTLTKPRKL